MKIALYLDPHSKLLKGRDADLTRVAQVLDHQIRYQAGPCWDRYPAVVAYYTDRADIPPDAYVITFYDNPDVPGAAGYHDEQGKPYGKVFAQPSIDVGSDVFTGAFPICRVACHEGLELWANRSVLYWCDRGDGTEVPLELCDAVELDDCIVTLKDGTSAPGSNFVHPSFFDPQSKRYATKWDHMGNLTGPLEMTSGGYQTVRSLTNGSVSQVFGENFPEKLRPAKRNPRTRMGRLNPRHN